MFSDRAIEYFGYVLSGAWLTLALALSSLAVAVTLGMLAAVGQLSRSTLLRTIAQTYTTLIRGVPPLVWMLLIFFGGQILVNHITKALGFGHVDVHQFVAGFLTLGFIFGAYMGETFRGAMLAVNQGEIEAAQAFGMQPFQVFRRVTFPAMLRHALPGFGNNWLVLLKDTALVSVIGLHDLVFRAGEAGRTVREPFTFYLLVALVFLCLTALSGVALSRLNKKAQIGVRQA